jgi:hypothetical protein
MHGPTGNITVLSTYGRKYGENKWSKLHSYFFWRQFKLMILNFFCPVYNRFYFKVRAKKIFQWDTVGYIIIDLYHWFYFKVRAKNISRGCNLIKIRSPLLLSPFFLCHSVGATKKKKGGGGGQVRRSNFS